MEGGEGKEKVSSPALTASTQSVLNSAGEIGSRIGQQSEFTDGASSETDSVVVLDEYVGAGGLQGTPDQGEVGAGGLQGTPDQGEVGAGGLQGTPDQGEVGAAENVRTRCVEVMEAFRRLRK